MNDDILARAFPGPEDEKSAADVARQDAAAVETLAEANERHGSRCACLACTWPLERKTWPFAHDVGWVD